jgi:hypothetical protein
MSAFREADLIRETLRREAGYSFRTVYLAMVACAKAANCELLREQDVIAEIRRMHHMENYSKMSRK